MGMDAEGLLASAAINLGLALVALSLFSMLKKQPGNAPVYRPRRIAAGDGGAGLLPLGHGQLTPLFRLSKDRKTCYDATASMRSSSSAPSSLGTGPCGDLNLGNMHFDQLISNNLLLLF